MTYTTAVLRWFERREALISAYAAQAWGVGKCLFCGRATRHTWCSNTCKSDRRGET